ncbi:AraC family transcriptional regulator ligand-binding domain-containing protein [Halopseudomonas bauzanensis]|uniref:AraC family transcriptional regulator ligand-binding domain-containing protein n=1 Tax=Halopseudomonas bauzanensis TaxID=653930 RepID=UPI00255707B1|nr:AraC family transcriptional regulator ligand-binding domain-containing protein [Halopseudomonas bauzanensis]
MSETDKKTRKPDISPVTRFHRGPMGRKLENYLQLHDTSERDYGVVELARLWRLAGKLEPAIGLHLFSQFTPQDWHILVYMVTFMEKVGNAFTIWEKYSPLVSDIETIQRIQEDGLVGVEISIDATDETARYIVEHYCVMSLTALRIATGVNVFPSVAEFKHPRPAYHEAYLPFFGDAVRFNCKHNRLLYNQDTAQLKTLGYNKLLIEVVCSELDRRIDKRHHFEGWAGKVAGITREAISAGKTPSLESVAEVLHHSPRTLRRRLAEQGFNYRLIIDAVRLELEQLWELQGLSRAQIGERLGYSETTAYLHARKRWA